MIKVKIRRKDREKKKDDINVRTLEKNTTVLYKLLHGWNLNKQKNDNFYIIHIVYNNDCDKKLADDLRKTLERNGHRTTFANYSHYVHNISDVPDYYIFINISAEEKNDNTHDVFRDYGCAISCCERKIFIDYNECYCKETNMDKFADYYSKITHEKIDYEGKRENIINTYKKVYAKEPSSKIIDWFVKSGEWLSDKTLNDLPPWLALAAAFIEFPLLVIVGLGAVLPIGLTETIVSFTLSELKKGNCDRKYFRQAQQHILLIKITDYIENLRLGNILSPHSAQQ